MIDKIISKFKDKNVAILGFGREGRSSYEFLRKYLPEQNLTIIDKNDVEKLDDQYVSYVTGDNYLNDLEQYDYIIKSPGISLIDIDTTNLLDKITSQLEMVLEVYKNNVIGITGTKGKSTTSSLMYEVIKEQNENVIFAGNIGIPILNEIEKCDSETLIVIEMSSHQLEYLNVSPRIGVVLNLFEDHLDHSGTVTHYHNNKMHMFMNQNEDDYMIYCSDNDTLNNLINNSNFKGKRYAVNMLNSNNANVYLLDDKVIYNNEVIYDTNDKRNLLGKHNIENIMVVLTISIILGLDLDRCVKTINEFKSLPYRLENIGTVDGVTYYTDTLATIPEATIEAIDTLKNVDTLIFGGMDRGIHYEKLVDYLRVCNVPNLICMPKTGTVIGKQLEGTVDKNFYYIDTLEEAVELAKKITKKDKICLLSPAAASYEYFKNYAEKGDKFKEYVYKKNN